MRRSTIKSLTIIAPAVLLLIIIGVAASHHFGLGSSLAQGPDTGDTGAPVPADGIFNSSTSAHARVELQLTISSLPEDMYVGSSVELYLENDF